MNPSPPLPRFQQLQHAFAAHLRDPARNPAPAGLEDRRVGVYRELIYNNIESLLAGNFPVIRKLLPDPAWRALVRGFMAEHRSHTPLFHEIGREFHRFLEVRAEHGAGDLPFLAELAHYEWVELAVAFDEQSIADIAHDPDGDVVQGCPVVSPLAWPLGYRFPVHRIRHDYQPEVAPAEPTFLVVARNRDEQVGFMQTTALSLRLLESLKANPGSSGQECVAGLATAFDGAVRHTVVAAGVETLRAFRARDVLLATREY
jgi:hypothetical protein